MLEIAKREFASKFAEKCLIFSFSSQFIFVIKNDSYLPIRVGMPSKIRFCMSKSESANG